MDKKAQTVTKLYEEGTITITPLHKKSGRNISEAHRAKLRERGKIKKTFVLSGKEKRKIRGSAIRLFKTRKSSLKWFTLTFTNKNVGEKEANKLMSNFFENLKQNYHAKNYVVVRENENKVGESHLHFHCLVDIPFTDYRLLNDVWCYTCRYVMSWSANALTSGDKKTIEDIRVIMFYVSKYITKAKEGESLTRFYFISRGAESKPAIIDFNTYIYLTTNFDCKIIVSDYFTIVFLNDFMFLPEKFVLNIKKRPKKETKKIRKPDFIQPNFNF